ncbi:MAG: PIN domain-containing protein [Candidatus Syntropharchaeia archaeon]
MNLEGPVEVVFDTSVIIGAILESYGKESGDASRNALTSLIERPYHILRISKSIREECENSLKKRGLPSTHILILLKLLEPKGKLKKVSIDQDMELSVSVHEDDRHVVETAVAVKGKRKGVTVCLVHKNPRHFDPIREELCRNHDILILTPEEYVDP